MESKSDIGKLLKKLREKRDLSTRQVSIASGVNQSYISQIERNVKKPSPETLHKLAPVYKTSYENLMTAAGYLVKEDNVAYNTRYPQGKTVQIPILGTVRCGEPIYAEQNIIGYETMSADEIRGSEYFYLMVTGDSMTGSRIYPGDRVLIRKQPNVENGQIAVVLVNGDEATLKKVKYLDDGSVMLIPDNNKYDPHIYKSEEVTIVGIVKKIEIDLTK